ncbi:glucose-fructose oxidoreductase domain-containing protein 1-like [Gigantopelta aegis]|uniref:glucose-fructose oxidoreductase domain-containing protein 1-like n=1 Tax=Gigantopelta aegis TaxID=1735272 RepID=UPI001B88BF60|nr:glucose-fructose oxidoreductase domain-containing protein 1-like [Gigantopelta aegis]
MKKMLPGVGVFGSTSLIRCIVPILKACGFKVIAIWSSTEEDAKELAKDLGIPLSTSKVDEVLLHKDVDLVVLSCSPHIQSPIAVKALNIGKHVLCGMPAGSGEKSAHKMVNAARYYPRLMSLICHGLRFLPVISKMKKLIQEDDYVGDITVCEVKVHCGSLQHDKFDWMCDELMGGGTLNTIGSSIIDVITFVTGLKALKVHGMLKTFTKQTDKIKGIREITSDDFCSFQMEMEDDACVNVVVNAHIPGNFIQEILICGTKGHLIVRGTDLFGQKSDHTKEDLLLFDRTGIKEEVKFGILEKIRKEIPSPYLKGVIRMIESVKDAFDREEQRQIWCSEPLHLAATFEDYFYTQTIIEAIKKSSKTKEWVKVVMVTDELEEYTTPVLRQTAVP